MVEPGTLMAPEGLFPTPTLLLLLPMVELAMAPRVIDAGRTWGAIDGVIGCIIEGGIPRGEGPRMEATRPRPPRGPRGPWARGRDPTPERDNGRLMDVSCSNYNHVAMQGIH